MDFKSVWITLIIYSRTYTGQFITVTGIPSSGKSDFVDQMVVGYNANYGWKTAFASPENALRIYMLTSLMRKTCKVCRHLKIYTVKSGIK